MKYIGNGCFGILFIISMLFIYGLVHFTRKKPEPIQMKYTDTLDTSRTLIKYDWNIGRYVYKDSRLKQDTTKYKPLPLYHKSKTESDMENAIQQLEPDK